MAKKWYPVIDYMECIECGICSKMCPHEVYDMDKTPTPVVKNPENCVDHCHGCGNKCPKGAITYVGDDTGWVPKNKKDDTVSCAACNSNSLKKILIEYMYLDLNVCDRCIGTEEILVKAMEEIKEELYNAGFEMIYRKVLIDTEEKAIKHHFNSSPSIRVNGYDLCETVQENHCGCCSDIACDSVQCRTYEFEGQMYEIPPVRMLAEFILKQAYSGNTINTRKIDYMLPENLKIFYTGKKKINNAACGCTRGCNCE
ncbi:MAG: DUF2703 domain-containing protein [Clostridiaceae bacterium]|nr:DUF2703 domain-containing protein [Clostridiaceae bacterium]